MVNVAIHSLFASHRRSRSALAADHSHRGVQRDRLTAAIVQVGARPRPPRPPARLHLAGLLSLASRALVLHRRAGDNGNSAPRLGASATSSTSAVSPMHGARPARPAARTAAGSRHNLAGLESAVGFERSQTAHFWPRLWPLFWRHLSATLFPYDTQKGTCPHRQGHVAIPADPTPHLVVAQAHLAPGRLDTFLHCPARPGHLHQFGQRGVRSGKGDIRCHLTRIADAAAHDSIILHRSSTTTLMSARQGFTAGSLWARRPFRIIRPPLRMELGDWRRCSRGGWPTPPASPLCRMRREAGLCRVGALPRHGLAMDRRLDCRRPDGLSARPESWHMPPVINSDMRAPASHEAAIAHEDRLLPRGMPPELQMPPIHRPSLKSMALSAILCYNYQHRLIVDYDPAT